METETRRDSKVWLPCGCSAVSRRFSETFSFFLWNAAHTEDVENTQPYHTNTWGAQAAVIALKKICKAPNHKRGTTDPEKYGNISAVTCPAGNCADCTHSTAKKIENVRVLLMQFCFSVQNFLAQELKSLVWWMSIEASVVVSPAECFPQERLSESSPDVAWILTSTPSQSLRIAMFVGTSIWEKCAGGSRFIRTNKTEQK